MVDFCMRYRQPFDRVEGAGDGRGWLRADRVFPALPALCRGNVSTANDQFFRALMSLKRQPAVRTVPEYFEHPLYIEALAQSVERAWNCLERKPDVLVASYHGMPQRYLMDGDHYHCQCQKTSRLLRERLGWDRGHDRQNLPVRLRTGRVAETLYGRPRGRACETGKKHIAVIAPAFSADCIETLEEINGEIRESFEHAGGEEFTYIPC